MKMLIYFFFLKFYQTLKEGKIDQN